VRRRETPWVVLLASAFTLASGYGLGLFVVAVYSDHVRRDLILLTLFFALLALFPILALRPTRPVEVPYKPTRRKRGWFARLLRRRRKNQPTGQMIWKRKPGQAQNQPWGTPEPDRRSVFIPARQDRRN